MNHKVIRDNGRLMTKCYDIKEIFCEDENNTYLCEQKSWYINIHNNASSLHFNFHNLPSPP